LLLGDEDGDLGVVHVVVLEAGPHFRLELGRREPGGRDGADQRKRHAAADGDAQFEARELRNVEDRYLDEIAGAEREVRLLSRRGEVAEELPVEVSGDGGRDGDRRSRRSARLGRGGRVADGRRRRRRTTLSGAGRQPEPEGGDAKAKTNTGPTRRHGPNGVAGGGPGW